MKGRDGKVTLAELFAGRSQLVIYHFMFGPDWQEGCPSCSFVSDHIDGALAHLAARDVTMVMVSRAPLAKIEAFKKRMGWRFKWVSSYGSDFNPDFHVSFTKDEMAQGKVNYNYTMQEFPSEEAPGISVFYKDADGDVFHTYSTYGRGVEPLVGTYMILDMVPKGRDEDQLGFTMEWVRHHDRYGTDEFADAKTSPTGRRRHRHRDPLLRIDGDALVTARRCCEVAASDSRFEPFTGGCMCGAVRYECGTDPIAMGIATAAIASARRQRICRGGSCPG